MRNDQKKKSSQLGCEDSGWSAVSGGRTHSTQSEGNDGMDELRIQAGFGAASPGRHQGLNTEQLLLLLLLLQRFSSSLAALLLHSHQHRAELTALRV